MALTLDDNQLSIVDTKRKTPRPQYFSAGTGAMTTITEDFEAFLILQGHQRNADTIKWLEQCTDFALRDIDRDGLAAAALQNELDDATNSQLELTATADLFNRFKQSYNMTGFENVAEAGLLLQDLQRPMQEMQSLLNRLVHRAQYSLIALNQLANEGVTSDEQQQVDSWFSPLSAY